MNIFFKFFDIIWRSIDVKILFVQCTSFVWIWKNRFDQKKKKRKQQEKLRKINWKCHFFLGREYGCISHTHIKRPKRDLCFIFIFTIATEKRNWRKSETIVILVDMLFFATPHLTSLAPLWKITTHAFDIILLLQEFIDFDVFLWLSSLLMSAPRMAPLRKKWNKQNRMKKLCSWKLSLIVATENRKTKDYYFH